MIPERLADDMTGPERDGHEFRYFLARAFIRRADTVLDAACGTGYGSQILAPHGSGVRYLGVDIEPVHAHTCMAHRFVEADLTTWDPSDPFDVGVSFETLEHVPDYHPLIATLKHSRKWIIASVPVVPTVGVNPFHCHDFVPGELAELFVDDDWELYQTLQQPSEVSEISVFRRR
jgi:SAM-dependent methyltransferase